MIRKLRWKVVGISMLLASTILLAVFAGVYFSARESLRRGSEQALQQAVQENVFDPLRPGQEHSSAPCFVAEIFPSGTVRVAGSSYYRLDDEAALTEIIEKSVQMPEERGLLKEFHLRYLRQVRPLSMRIAFTDSTLEQAALRSLVGVSLLICLGALLVLLLCSYFLSALVTRPVKRSWESQQRFLSDASHELKTPLTVILSSAELLREGGDEEENRRCVDNIRSESRRMRALVEDMLTLSRLEGRKQPFESVDLSDLVLDAALRFEPVAYEAGRKLRYQVAEGITLSGNGGQLSQLCDILIDNAIRYAPPQSTVDLMLHCTERAAVLKVENPGEPIPPEKLSHLFERFYRADESRSGQQGFGLGLAIARSITEEHGGVIRCRSDGQSTCFTAALPLHSGEKIKEKTL